MSGPAGWPRIERIERDRAATGLAVALVAGALAVVLAGLQSGFFDLERHSVPKELALHATALVCVAVLARGWRGFRLGVVDIALFGFVIWSGASALLAENRWLSLRAFGVTLSGYVLYRAGRRIAWGPEPDARASGVRSGHEEPRMAWRSGRMHHEDAENGAARGSRAPRRPGFGVAR